MLMRWMKDTSMGSTRLHIQYVVLYNWLVAITIIPFALGFVWPLSVLTVWVSVVCVIAYICFEIAAFVLERNWSNISVWRFWRISAPLIICQALLCLLAATHDALGCLLFSALCLGVREALFQLQDAGSAAGGYDLKERVMAALTGGFAYATSLAIFCGFAYTLIRIIQYKETMAPGAFHVMYAVLMPLARGLSWLLLAQLVSSAALAQSSDVPQVLSQGEARPHIDALVMYADLAFAIAVFLEIPFAFVFLLIPHVATFCVATACNMLLDVAFVWALDALQQRRMRLALMPPAPKLADASGPDQWSPTYCIERPKTLLATVMSCSLSHLPNEKTRLTAQEAPDNAGRLPAKSEAPPTNEEDPEAPWYKRYWASARRSFDSAGEKSRECCTSFKDTCSVESDGSMSPRVSHLLEEYDSMVIKCRGGWNGLRGNSSGQIIYLFQERKITLLTHLLSSTLAFAIAASTVWLLRLHPQFAHTISWQEILIRICVLLVLRILADLIACRVLEWSCEDLDQKGRCALWDGRADLSTWRAWAHRVIVGLCPLFAVVAATMSA
eukprot:gnl/TRDRNA2_/TRDRNA2_183510_c0_seq1.p1 gnl/TRDRNA2_/TRDRNA2_183510_c0~~gnl/TRDRNA2_/TRDRNA2_183510_c0_seq1.p1  ORF type:complete len:556 (+),score=61.33 gnl/TRDRNA2_/TRDRNA2_183510_c0_seq1:284-1951(+)